MRRDLQTSSSFKDELQGTRQEIKGFKQQAEKDKRVIEHQQHLLLDMEEQHRVGTELLQDVNRELSNENEAHKRDLIAYRTYLAAKGEEVDLNEIREAFTRPEELNQKAKRPSGFGRIQLSFWNSFNVTTSTSPPPPSGRNT